MTALLDQASQKLQSSFSESKRILSFSEFIKLTEENPCAAVRNSYDYLLDAIHHFGSEKKEYFSQELESHNIFQRKDTRSSVELFGHEELQAKFTKLLTGFVRTGKANRLIVLHGPNGSAKSTFVKKLFEGMEAYSYSTEGRLFQFSWVFPQDIDSKKKMGIASAAEISSDLNSFARLEQEKIGAIVRSELHENPLFLLPPDIREKFLDQWIEKTTKSHEKRYLQHKKEALLKGELSHKNALIFEALMDDYSGDFTKVLRHVRVERFYLSTRFRRGLVSIEPKFGVDANIRQVTLDQSMAHLPPALQSLNLFQLEGDLIDGNRGIIEYNDFLKRPVESFKYLLSTCESSSVNLGHVVVFLDTLLMATSNDRQIEAFREHPEFYSFKSRLEFIRVPYLLKISDEEKIYAEFAERARGPKELMPHTTRILATWAVLTRLKKPFTKDKNTLLTRVLEKISPLEKAKLYDDGTLPEWLNEEERREMRSHAEALSNEHKDQVFYEGLLGASARELKTLLHIAAQNPSFNTLSPRALFHELKALVQKKMDYDYLRLEAVGAYHSFEAFIEVVQEEWFNTVDKELRSCIHSEQEEEVKKLLHKYFQHIIPYVKNEKVKDRITGKYVSPDSSFMDKIEKKFQFTSKSDDFRRNLISRLGAWAVDKKSSLTGTIPYEEVFPDLARQIEQHYRSQGSQKIQDLRMSFLSLNPAQKESPANASEKDQQALEIYQSFQSKYNYGPLSAHEAISELIKKRYS